MPGLVSESKEASIPRTTTMRFHLGLFWFLYMAGLGTFFPFYSLYLSERLGLSGSQVGLVTATLPAVGLVAQPLWGQLADRTGSRRLVLALMSLGVAMAHLLLGFLEPFATALLGTALLSAFLTVVLPMATAVSLGALAERGPDAFGHVRMWGTLGFLCAVIVFPRLAGESGPALLGVAPWRGLGTIFPVAAVCSLAAALAALTLPKAPSLTLRAKQGETRRLLRHRPAIRLFLLAFCAHTCMQGPIYLFPLFIAEQGGDVADVGSMWIFMLLLEIPLIGFSGATLRRLGPRGVLQMGLLAEAIRWTTCALSNDLAVIGAVQLLHGVGVAGVIIGAPLYLERSVPEELRATGQALISTAGFGAGAIVSNALGGWLFEHVDPRAPYALAAIGLTLICLLLYRWLPEPYRPGDSSASADSR